MDEATPGIDPDAVVDLVGDVHAAVGPDGDLLRLPQLGARGRAAVALAADLAGARDNRHHLPSGPISPVPAMVSITWPISAALRRRPSPRKSVRE
jgi:hypothetical protein